jgi:hypothetical protein
MKAVKRRSGGGAQSCKKVLFLLGFPGGFSPIKTRKKKLAGKITGKSETEHIATGTYPVIRHPLG